MPLKDVDIANIAKPQGKKNDTQKIDKLVGRSTAPSRQDPLKGKG
jgi:hypothetical protein